MKALVRAFSFKKRVVSTAQAKQVQKCLILEDAPRFMKRLALLTISGLVFLTTFAPMAEAATVCLCSEACPDPFSFIENAYDAVYRCLHHIHPFPSPHNPV
jgi:hypothetical protein